MLEDISFKRENMILALMAKITSIPDLDSVLDTIVLDASEIVEANYCLMFLQPQYVSKFSDTSDRKGNISESPFRKDDADIVVLAATSQEHQKPQIGNTHFALGEGITGWVYEKKKNILIQNRTDADELKRISQKLSWVSKFDEDQVGNKMRSILAIPLIAENLTIGVLEFHGVKGDSTLSETRATIIANFSASVINNLYINKSRKQFLMSLAHAMNSPLTGILADSENLYQELPKDTEFHQTAKHIFGQVLRLHMQTATLMAVLSEQSATRQFSEHSIYRPLKEACELFESEALQKGLEILGPSMLDKTL